VAVTTLSGKLRPAEIKSREFFTRKVASKPMAMDTTK